MSEQLYTLNLEVDIETVKLAKIRLRIKLPVLIQFSHTMPKLTFAGTHQVITAGKTPKHLVKLSKAHTIYYGLNYMNEVLWHELTHAKQYEEYVRTTGDPNFHAFYKAAAGDLGAEYLHNKFEIEARLTARNNKHIMLLKENNSG